MGMIIKFESRFSGESRVTSCVAAVAGWIASETELRTAIVQFGNKKNDVCEMFLKYMPDRLREEVIKKTGLATLLLLLREGRPNEEKVRDSALKTVDSKLDIFHGVGFVGEENLKAVMIDVIAACYDVVLLDSPDSKDVASDVVVRLIPQNRKKWKDVLTKDLKGNNRIVYCINGYLKNSVSNSGLFRLKYKKNLIPLRMSVGFMDAIGEGSVVEFFKMINRLGRIMPDHGFVNDVTVLARELLKGGGIES